MLIFGEVHTGLLQHSIPLAARASEQVLALRQGERVRRFERPIAAAASPELLTGVDCRLPTASGARVRGVGTVRQRALIVGGHLLQGSAVTRVGRSATGRRLPWSHYLARPGQVETIGRADWSDLVEGFGGVSPGPAVLDLRAICQRVMDTVQAAHELDRAPPFRTTRTRLRWVARLSDHTALPAVSGPDPGPADELVFEVEGRAVRTLRLDATEAETGSVVAFCEDLARHDWLLSTLLDLLERSRVGAGARAETLLRLRPALDYLLHLWMPAARADATVQQLWDDLERRSGFSRQWQVSVDRIRDQVAIGITTVLGDRAGSAHE